ncbi:MAG: hypothetical protein K6B28_14105 [Lachnospiraceae bacterium]|nr:hypothetical protein [Lachnospiraceae bacterium]
MIFEKSFESSEHDLIGKWYYESIDSRRYVGIFKDQYFNTGQSNPCKDVVHEKAEFLSGIEGTSYELGKDCKEYILPIAATESCMHNMIIGEKRYLIAQYHPYRFSYYRLPSMTRIESGSKCIYGNPIPIRLDKKKKRLVMSIFIDGLVYSILKGKTLRQTCLIHMNFSKKVSFLLMHIIRGSGHILV